MVRLNDGKGQYDLSFGQIFFSENIFRPNVVPSIKTIFVPIKLSRIYYNLFEFPKNSIIRYLKNQSFIESYIFATVDIV